MRSSSSSSSSPCLREAEELDLVDRIRLTQPVWHRTKTNRAAAIHLLLNKPPGTFIIRDAVERKDACLMLSMVTSSYPKTQVSHDPIYRSPPQKGSHLHLANSHKAFPDLTSLIAFYCSNEDSTEQLPHLVLPKEILAAKTRQCLVALSQLGHYFWIPSLFGRSYSLPVEVSVSLSDGRALDATRRSLCSTPSSESIVSSPLASDREETLASQYRSVDHQSRSTSVIGCQSNRHQLRISGGKAIDDHSGYVSSSESGSDVNNGMIYYRSDPAEKLSDYEDIWPYPSSPTSSTLPSAFPGSRIPSSPRRLPTPVTVNRSVSSPVSLLFSHLNHVSSNCSSVAERQALASDVRVAAADVHCKRSSQAQKEVSRIDLNQESVTKKGQAVLGFPHQLKFPRQCRRIRSKKSLVQNSKQVPGNAEQKENYKVTKMECHRLETTGVFHFDFQQTSRLASHVAQVTRSPLQYTSPGYALPYDALPAAMKGLSASGNKPLMSQSRSYLFTSVVDSKRQTLASAPLHPGNSLAPNCNHDNCNNAAGKPPNPDFRNTAYNRSFRNNTSAMISKTEGNEMHRQRFGLRPTVSDPQHCFRDTNLDADDETIMEAGYRLPFDALLTEMNVISCHKGMNQMVPSHRISQASNSVSKSSRAGQGVIEEAQDNSGITTKKSLRASFSAIQKKIFRISQKKLEPQESFSCPEKQKTEAVDVPRIICTHPPHPESQLAAVTKTVMVEDEPTSSNISLRRQVVNLKRRRRSVYDNVCTPSYRPLLNPFDIAQIGTISPSGDRHDDNSPYGDDAFPRSRRMTAVSHQSTLSTATEYCQPWETLHLSQLLDQKSIPNSPWDCSVQTQCSYPDPINGVHGAFLQRPFENDYCAEARKVVDKSHHFPEEANGAKDIWWSQRPGNSDFSILVPSNSTAVLNSSEFWSNREKEISLLVCSNNLRCNSTNYLGTGFSHSVRKTDTCVGKSKVVNCGAVPFSDSSCAADMNRNTETEVLCCSGNASKASFSDSCSNQGNDRETLVVPMSPDVIPQSVSVDEPSPCGGRGEELTTATRIYNFITKLTQSKEGFLGKIVQTFIECTKNATEQNPKNVVRNVRQFITGLKNYLIHKGEEDLNDLIRSESDKMKPSEFLNLDVILERVFDDCIVQMLHEHIYRLFVLAYTRDGQLQSMSEGIKFARSKTSFTELGLPTESSCENSISSALHFLTMMEDSPSPTKKFLFLQSAIRAIDSRVEMNVDSESRTSVQNTEGLISSLVHVLLDKGLVSAQIELDYMQGLMEKMPAITPEGSYHLGLFSCAVKLIKNMTKNRHSATNNNAHCNSSALLGDVLLSVHVPDEKFNNVIDIKIPLQPNSLARDICNMMAYKMRVTNPQDYGLFHLNEGTETRLVDLMKIFEFLSTEKAKASTADSVPCLVYKRVNAKFIWPRSLRQNMN